MLKPSSLAKWGVAVLLLSSLSSCEDIFEQYFPKPSPTPPPTVPTTPSVAYALSSRSGGPRLNFTRLATFNPENPAEVVSKPVTGLSIFTRLIALDRRPATGQFYALGTDQRLYTLDVNSGAATLVSEQPLPIASFADIGFDFNPVTDQIRIVNREGTNIRVNPTDGTAIEVDAPLNPRPANSSGAGIVGIAYDNNVAGATSTRLFAVGGSDGQLWRLDDPNTGTLTPVGVLGAGSVTDFDIGRTSNTGYGLRNASFGVSGVINIYRIDLATSSSTLTGTFTQDRDFFFQGFTLGE